MKKRSKILLILLGVLLIGTGVFLQCKDDVQQYFVEQELSAYAPDPDMFAALEDKIPPLQTTDAAVMGTEKVTQFSQISGLDELQKTLLTTQVIDAVSNTSTTLKFVSGSISKSQTTKKVQRSTTTTVMQNENTNAAMSPKHTLWRKFRRFQIMILMISDGCIFQTQILITWLCIPVTMIFICIEPLTVAICMLVQFSWTGGAVLTFRERSAFCMGIT